MTIRQTLLDVGETYLAAKSEPFKAHPVAHLLKKEGPENILEALSDPYFKAYGSAGQFGTWTHVPWIGVFDPMVTTSAQRGHYVVYLFRTDMKSVALSLNQGVWAVFADFKNKLGPSCAELERRAALMRARVPEFTDRFSNNQINLIVEGDARAYESGHAFGKQYSISELPDERELSQDLKEIVRLYGILTARGGPESFREATQDEKDAGYETVIERRKYRYHRSIERSSGIPTKVKKALGYRCQACSLDFESVYGDIGRNYIEAHHLTPISKLPENQRIKLNPKKDFAVLCANCHRMIHKKDAPKEIEEFSEIGRLTALQNYFKSLNK